MSFFSHICSKMLADIGCLVIHWPLSALRDHRHRKVLNLILSDSFACPFQVIMGGINFTEHVTSGIFADSFGVLWTANIADSTKQRSHHASHGKPGAHKH
jgi:hypothetical protein